MRVQGVWKDWSQLNSLHKSLTHGDVKVALKKQYAETFWGGFVESRGSHH